VCLRVNVKGLRRKLRKQLGATRLYLQLTLAPSNILHNLCILLKENAKPASDRDITRFSAPLNPLVQKLGRVLVKWQL